MSISGWTYCWVPFVDIIIRGSLMCKWFLMSTLDYRDYHCAGDVCKVLRWFCAHISPYITWSCWREYICIPDYFAEFLINYCIIWLIYVYAWSLYSGVLDHPCYEFHFLNLTAFFRSFLQHKCPLQPEIKPQSVMYNEHFENEPDNKCVNNRLRREGTLSEEFLPL